MASSVDSRHGSRDLRGHWSPVEGVAYPPVFVWPPRPWAAVRWFFSMPGYLLPLNAVYFAIAVATWIWIPFFRSWSASPSLPAGLSVLASNAGLTLVYFGMWHVFLYRRRSQGTEFKFNPRWPSPGNRNFLFGDQVVDNFIWTLVGVGVWTCYELSCLWWLASGQTLTLGWNEHPFLFAGLLLAIPLIQEAHFYLVHRFILHDMRLYRLFHKLHHRNVNPGPWSGLAMHPIEHMLYFSSVLVHLVIPSHPIHVIFHVTLSALAPAAAHAGFQKIVLAGRWLMPADGFAHYLHHKLFECNYSDGVIPLDKWFGTLCDGSPGSIAAMSARARMRKQPQDDDGRHP